MVECERCQFGFLEEVLGVDGRRDNIKSYFFVFLQDFLFYFIYGILIEYKTWDLGLDIYFMQFKICFNSSFKIVNVDIKRVGIGIK